MKNGGGGGHWCTETLNMFPSKSRTHTINNAQHTVLVNPHSFRYDHKATPLHAPDLFRKIFLLVHALCLSLSLVYLHRQAEPLNGFHSNTFHVTTLERGATKPLAERNMHSKRHVSSSSLILDTLSTLSTVQSHLSFIDVTVHL